MWKYTRILAEIHLIFKGSLWLEDDTYAGRISYVDCSDVFWWGSTDAQEFDENTCADLETCFAVCGNDYLVGTSLYCARVRKMRPQGAYYHYIPQQYWELFNACGPERELGLGNPFPIGDYHPS